MHQNILTIVNNFRNNNFNFGKQQSDIVIGNKSTDNSYVFDEYNE